MLGNHSITIRLQDVLKGVGIVVLVYLMYLMWDILLLIFVSIIFAALIDPFASALAKRRIPRGIAVLIVYVAFFGIVGVAIGVLAPVVVHDVPQLINSTDDVLTNIFGAEWTARYFGGNPDAPLSEASNWFVLAGSADGTLAGLFSTVSGFFGGVVSLLIILVMTFYLVSQDDPLGKMLRSIVPDRHLPYASALFRRMRDKLGAWLRGQIMLSLLIGVIVTIGLSIVGVKYAAVLGLLAALLEFIPILGPIFASLPALLFAFSAGGWVTCIIVLIMYVLIQQFENHILVPKVMQRAVGLNPIVSIIAILVGVRVAGVLGVLLAIPVATALSVVIGDILEKQKQLPPNV